MKSEEGENNSPSSISLDMDEELRFSQQRGFFDQSAVIRLLIGVLFTCCLFLFLHYREVRVDILELNTIAQRYVVAQVDFDFPDEEATGIFKQEAVRDIGKVYKIDEKEIRQRRQDFETALVQKQGWRKLSDSTFDEMSQGIDLFESALLKARFTDARTLQKMKDVNFVDINYQLGLLTTAPATIERAGLLPPEVWQTIESIAFSEAVLPITTIVLIADTFKSKEWETEEDLHAERSLRRLVQAHVPEKYTHVTAGRRIIDQGEKVTSRHMVMLQAMKGALSKSRNLWHPVTIAGSLIMALLFVGMGVAYLHTYHAELYTSNRKTCLLVSVLILTLALSKMTEYLLLRNTSNLIDVVRYPLLVPFAAILLTSLLNPRIAAAATGFLVVVLTMTLAVNHIGFLVINLVTAIAAILSMHALRKRKEVFVVCLKAWLICIVIVVAFNLYDYAGWNMIIVTDLFSTLAFMLMTAVLVVGVLPLFESLFRIMTDITLMEYMDPSNEVLQRLMHEAPGTYQHSIVVGNLAESAALAIGANGLFCRVSTHYHDIGKLVNPYFFTENQPPGVNMHQLLEPLESTQVIISHVSEGVAMARRIGLPEQFIDIIKEHHGTTLVYYFYHKQLERMEGDRSKVPERDYRYAGPRPRSKESAIIMMADTVEAASRSLEELNDETLTELVDRLVREKAEDGQLDTCLLTFEELGLVKRAMVKTLVASGHARIKYPKRLAGHRP